MHHAETIASVRLFLKKNLHGRKIKGFYNPTALVVLLPELGTKLQLLLGEHPYLSARWPNQSPGHTHGAWNDQFLQHQRDKRQDIPKEDRELLVASAQMMLETRMLRQESKQLAWITQNLCRGQNEMKLEKTPPASRTLQLLVTQPLL